MRGRLAGNFSQNQNTLLNALGLSFSSGQRQQQSPLSQPFSEPPLFLPLPPRNTLELHCSESFLSNNELSRGGGSEQAVNKGVVESDFSKGKESIRRNPLVMNPFASENPGSEVGGGMRSEGIRNTITPPGALVPLGFPFPSSDRRVEPPSVSLGGEGRLEFCASPRDPTPSARRRNCCRG